MVSHVTPIIAQVQNPKQIEKLRGEGEVERKIDDHTYTLRFSSGKINVILTSGSLTPQTRVRIKHQGNQITIVPVTPQKNSSDQITFSQNHSEDSLGNVLQKLLTIVSQTHPDSDIDQTIRHYKIIADTISAEIQNNPDFFHVNNALKTLGEKLVDACSKTVHNKESIAQINELIRTFEITLIELSGEKQKSMVLPKAVESGFSYFTTGQDAIDWLDQTQPSLDKSNLNQLLLSKSDPVIIQTITSTDGPTVVTFINNQASSDLIDFFIHNEAKSPLWETLSPDLFLSVLKSKGSITHVTLDSIDKILQSLSSNHSMAKGLSSNGVNYLIQQWIALMLDNPEALQPISKQFPVEASADFGKNFEQLATKLFPNTPLQSEVVRDVLTNTIKNTGIPKTDSIIHAFAKMGYNLEHTLKQPEDMESPLKKETMNSIKNQLFSLLLPYTTENDGQPLIPKTVENSLLNPFIQIRNQISQLFQQLDFTNTKFSLPQWQTVVTSFSSPAQNCEKTMQNIISNAKEQCIQTIQAFHQGDIDQETVSKNLKSLSNSLSSDINKLFDSIIKDSMTHIERSTKDGEKYPQQILRQIPQLISQIKQEIEHLARTIEQNIDAYISQNQKGHHSNLPEGMRQQVETMLSRFESLQLLSKPIPTADGQQQVVSFPVKFGEEWTDVKILLIKKKNKKRNKTDQKNFSVRMHVAPSHCGAVNINMDYNFKYKLNVNIEFEKNESRLWFNKYKDQLIGALKENGIPSVSLSLVSGLQSTPGKKKNITPIASKKNRKNTKIDINV